MQVTTDIGYDGFGNVNSTVVTGSGMDPRSTTTIYSDATYTTGQFPLSIARLATATFSRDHDMSTGTTIWACRSTAPIPMARDRLELRSFRPPLGRHVA